MNNIAKNIMTEANRLYKTCKSADDKIKFLELYNKASDMGNIHATIKLANIYSSDYLIKLYRLDDEEMKTREYIINSLYTKAINAKEYSCIGDYISFMHNSKYYKDYSKITELLEIAISLEDVQTMVDFALFISNDASKSLELFEKALLLDTEGYAKERLNSILIDNYLISQNKEITKEFKKIYLDKYSEENTRLSSLVEEAELFPCCGKQFKEAQDRFNGV